jgi:hypothetical protein
MPQTLQHHSNDGAGGYGGHASNELLILELGAAAYHLPACSLSSAALPRPRCAPLQVQYKYQITVDGISHSWDGSYWKLASGSRVFWVLSDPSINSPLWLPWYYPLLIPDQHYTPVHVAQLEPTVRAAMQNDAESRQMGADAYNHMRCNVNFKAAAKYLELLVRRVQMWYAANERSASVV